MKWHSVLCGALRRRFITEGTTIHTHTHTYNADVMVEEEKNRKENPYNKHSERKHFRGHI